MGGLREQVLISLQNEIMRQYIEGEGGRWTNDKPTVNIIFDLKTTLGLTKNRLDDPEKNK